MLRVNYKSNVRTILVLLLGIYAIIIKTISIHYNDDDVPNNNNTNVGSSIMVDAFSVVTYNVPKSQSSSLSFSPQRIENMFFSNKHNNNYPQSTSFTPKTSSSIRTVSSIIQSQTTISSTALHMFTGIVEEMGSVVAFTEQSNMVQWDGTIRPGYELVVQSKDGIVFDGIYLGCSICVSGVCLTVTEFDRTQQQFTVGVAPETISRTYFASFRTGDTVNLERAATIGGRNSGHTVQGHVDCTGTIITKFFQGNSLKITIQLSDPTLIQYIVPKGFIAIDGTSLTVIDVDPSEETFTFMLIEYTQNHIIIPQKQIGDSVNIEVDVVAKYAAAAAAATASTSTKRNGSMITTIDPTIVATLLSRIETLESKVLNLEQTVRTFQRQQQ